MSKASTRMSVHDEQYIKSNKPLQNRDIVVFTKSEACFFLKCGMSTLPKLGLPVIKVGRSVKYLKSDLESYLLSNRQGGVNE